MSHPQQVEFCNFVKSLYPSYFKNVKVADFGSLDINGCNKPLFENSEYIGIDLGIGKNVDVVSIAHEYDAPDEYFDVVISTEMFEHDKFLNLTLQNIIRVLRSGGLFLFTCGGDGRPEHGTKRTTPYTSPFTSNMNEWDDFYENLNETKLRSMINLDEVFSEYKIDIKTDDFRFYGIKK